MLSDESAAKIDQGLAKLAEDQRTGDAPPSGEVTLKVMARYCGVSEATILKLERIALAKVHAKLMAEASHLLPVRCRPNK